MSGTLLEAVAVRFRALAEPTRLLLLQELMSGERSVSDLTAASGLSQANTSKHLGVLRATGFLDRRKVGTTVYYAIADPVVHTLCEAMCAHITAQARAGARAVRSG